MCIFWSFYFSQKSITQNKFSISNSLSFDNPFLSYSTYPRNFNLQLLYVRERSKCWSTNLTHLGMEYNILNLEIDRISSVIRREWNFKKCSFNNKLWKFRKIEFSIFYKTCREPSLFSPDNFLSSYDDKVSFQTC